MGRISAPILRTHSRTEQPSDDPSAVSLIAQSVSAASDSAALARFMSSSSPSLLPECIEERLDDANPENEGTSVNDLQRLTDEDRALAQHIPAVAESVRDAASNATIGNDVLNLIDEEERNALQWKHDRLQREEHISRQHDKDESHGRLPSTPHQLTHESDDVDYELRTGKSFFVAESALHVEHDIKVRTSEMLQQAANATRDQKRSVRPVSENIVKVTVDKKQVQYVAEQIAKQLQPLSGSLRSVALHTLAVKALAQVGDYGHSQPSFVTAISSVFASLGNIVGSDVINIMLAQLINNTHLAVPKLQKKEGSGCTMSDSTLAQMSAHMNFLGALQHAGAPMPEEHFAWKYVARLLNAIPPCKVSACALEAFLSSAGCTMSSLYGADVMDALAVCILNEFIPAMERVHEDSVAARYRMTSLLRNRTYLQPPEGAHVL
jgi:hypothetical protein